MFSKVVSSSQCWMYLRYEKAFERIVSGWQRSARSIPTFAAWKNPSPRAA